MGHTGFFLFLFVNINKFRGHLVTTVPILQLEKACFFLSR